MHPALSVILFTTASGAGYGLLAAIGIGLAAGFVPRSQAFGFVGLGLALALITAGLLSSTAHLGRPERSWRAVSQWRTSWLSREGVLALATYLPAGLLGILWAILGRVDGLALVCALLSALLAILTIGCTAMIYRSLKPIHQWHNDWVVPNYGALAAATGLLWLNALLQGFGAGSRGLAVVTLLVIALAAGLKHRYWSFIDGTRSASTAETATGLGALGRVRLLEAPHSEENYLLKEMGFRIARKHAVKLRRIALGAGFAAPFLLTLLALVTGGAVAIAASLIAAVVAMLGVVIERWLFFAEAKHTVTLYYGAATA